MLVLILIQLLFSAAILAKELPVDDGALVDINLADFNDLTLSYGDGDQTLYAFVSPTCPVCQRFHAAAKDELVSMGVNLRYFVIGSAHDRSFDLAADIYCAESPKGELNNFRSHLLGSSQKGAGAKCKPIVEDVNALAYLLRIKATPMFVFPNGKTMNGFADVETLLKAFMSNQ